MDNKSFKKFLSKIRAEFDKQMLQHPYQMNLIDEIVENNKNLDETAHSKILARLLQYRDKEGKYIFLKSLLTLKNAEGQGGWNHLSISNPIITTEVFCSSEKDRNGRIDILIEDDDYSIIIENKTNDANDQRHQLGRYIEKVKQNISEDKIYVIYLPKNDGSQPSDDSWLIGEEDKGYEETFKDRFSVFGFKKAIRHSWLEEVIIKNLNDELLLKSSALLYKDYLDSLFNERKTENEVIKSLLSNYEKDYKEEAEFLRLLICLEDKINNERKLARNGSEIRRAEINKERKHLYGGLSSLYSFIPSRSVSGRRVLHIGYEVNIKNREYTVYIGNNSSGMFCSILSKKDGKAIDNEKIFKALNLKNEGTGYLFDGYDRDYRILPKLELFLKVMDKCEELKREEQTKKV